MSYIKNKLINDPIYGFIRIPFSIIWEIIEHPYFQRLRRISQLGLSSLVYPGANHNRFHHAIGATHLMCQAIDTLRLKGVEITKKEQEAALIAILLHDIGHGPFSHALENSIVKNLSHEAISKMFMHELNKEFQGKLSLAIEIFEKKYHKKFLHQLISSQLDVDRLDYLNRDSFYSGVKEGTINSNRIIAMFNVKNGHLVIDYKGIYSIEKFIMARKLMYLQVYLHKTVLSAEHTLMQVLKRAKHLVSKKKSIYTTPSFSKFLFEKNDITTSFFKQNRLLHNFSMLDDYDIMTCIKEWANEKDIVMKFLANSIINRKLLKIKHIHNNEKNEIQKFKNIVINKFKLNALDAEYLVFPVTIKNEIYSFNNDEITFLQKNNTVLNVSELKQEFNINEENAKVIKHYICMPSECLD